jgi:hypothetical protein
MRISCKPCLHANRIRNQLRFLPFYRIEAATDIEEKQCRRRIPPRAASPRRSLARRPRHRRAAAPAVVHGAARRQDRAPRAAAGARDPRLRAHAADYNGHRQVLPRRMAPREGRLRPRRLLPLHRQVLRPAQPGLPWNASPSTTSAEKKDRCFL